MIKGDYRDLRPWVCLIGFLILVYALRVAGNIISPLAMAAFVAVLVWPLQAWLERRLPASLSVLLTVTAVLTVFALLGVLVWICVGEIVSKAGEYRQLFESLLGRVDAALARHHLPSFESHFSPDRLVGQVVSLAGSFAAGAYRFTGFVVLVIVFVVLILIEVRPFSRQLKERLDRNKAEKLANVVQSTAMSIHRFMLTRTLTSSLVGISAGVFTWSIGLDFPLVWAVLSFVLNYVPFLGAIAAVIPPSLVALVQPGSLWVSLAAPIGLSLIHFIVGNYVDPLLQGHYLSLPPLLVFYSIVFWGWVWGIPGAVIGVPLTMATVITCQHFEGTRWLARLLLKDSV